MIKGKNDFERIKGGKIIIRVRNRDKELPEKVEEKQKIKFIMKIRKRWKNAI